MRRVSVAPAFALLAASILLVSRAGASTLVPPLHDEEAQREAREAWRASLHAAAPGTDWRAIEAANHEAARLLLDARPFAATAAAWSERGAVGVTGRTMTAAASLATPGRIFVGTALGGLWSGDAHGATAWTPMTDALGIGVAQVVVVPRVAGRDDFAITDGNGRVFASADGGVTWSVPSGLPSGAWGGRRLLQDPSSPLRLYLMLKNWFWTGSAWEVDDYLLRSTDGGLSWITLMHVPEGPGNDFWISRVSGSNLYWLSGRTFLRSTDAGATFVPIGVLAGSAATTDVRLAASEAGAPKFYATVQDAGGWSLHTSNGGASWQLRVPTMTDYWGTLGAAIGDSSLVFAGGVDLRRSTNGGASFAPVNSWVDYYSDPTHALHADMMSVTSLRVPPVGGGAPQEMTYVHCDGGTYEMPLASAVPTNLTQADFRNSQYYGLRTSPIHPNVISAGSQDQGYQVTTAPPAFTQVISGDYGHLTGSASTNDMVWSCYPGFLMLQTQENPVALDLPASGSGYPSDTGIQWMPFLRADPADPTAVYFAARHLWRVKHTAPGTFASLASYGDFDNGTGDFVGAFAIAPSNRQRWYVATGNGRFWYSSNAGATWTLSPSAGPGSHYFYGSDLIVSPTNPLVAYACGSGYSNPGVYVTTDGGATWSPYGAGLPSTLVHGLAFDNATSQVVYAATEAGPWRCVGGTWQNLLLAAPGAPLTDYWCVESVPALGVVRFGTYGRGIWDFQTGATLDAGESRGRTLRLTAGPSPTPGAATIAWSQAHAGDARVEVFDVTGRRVAAPVAGWRPAGAQAVAFDGRDDRGHALAEGLYLVRLVAGDARAVARLLVRR